MEVRVGEFQPLEEAAAEMLSAAGPYEYGEDWPEEWKAEPESEHERLAAAHTGLLPLPLAAIAGMYPEFDPAESTKRLSEILSAKPGVDPELVEDCTEAEGFHAVGKDLPARQVWERCRWLGCGTPLYSPERPRGRGNPRKYCPEHQKAAKNRTERLRYQGISVGRNRNLVYDFPGLAEQDLTEYRKLWVLMNTTGIR